MGGSDARRLASNPEEDVEFEADAARVRAEFIELAVRVEETIQASRQCTQDARTARASVRAERERLRGYLDQLETATDRLRGGHVALTLIMRSLGRQDHRGPGRAE
jgi:hypothetical protein